MVKVFLVILLVHLATAESLQCVDPKFHPCADQLKCVSEWFFCDGKNDCNDSSDELGCENFTCARYKKKCDDNIQCVREKYTCDGRFHCNDESDEQGCDIMRARDPQSGKRYIIQNHTAAPLPGYDSAVEACREIQGILLEPMNEEEDNFLETLTAIHGFLLPLGMKDNVTEGTWLWGQDGSPVTYFNWLKWVDFEPQEPNGGIEENCAFRTRYYWYSSINFWYQVVGKPNQRWVDGSCTEPVEMLVCDVSAAHWCDSLPCVNGGTCENTLRGFQCRCTRGYTGRHCETRQDF